MRAPWLPWAALYALTLVGTAFAATQTVTQSGVVSPGHAPVWVGSGVVQDAGPATNGNLTELGIYKNGGLPMCITSSTISKSQFNPSSSPYTQECLFANQGGRSGMTLNSYNGAGAANFVLNLNGTDYSFPSGGAGTGNVIGPNSSTVGDVAIFNSMNGQLLADGGKFKMSALPAVATEAALAALTSTPASIGNGTSVLLAGYYLAGDLGTQTPIYTYGSSACSLSSGNGDNGSQVKSSLGGCWNVAQWGGLGPTIKNWGAICDGTQRTSPDTDLVAARSAVAWALASEANQGAAPRFNFYEPPGHCEFSDTLALGDSGTPRWASKINGDRTTWEFTNDTASYSTDWTVQTKGLWMKPTGSPADGTGAILAELNNMTIIGPERGAAVMLSFPDAVRLNNVTFQTTGSLTDSTKCRTGTAPCEGAENLVVEGSENTGCYQCSYGAAFWFNNFLTTTKLFTQTNPIFNDNFSLIDPAFSEPSFANIADSGSLSQGVHTFLRGQEDGPSYFYYLAAGKPSTTEIGNTWTEQDYCGLGWTPPAASYPTNITPSTICPGIPTITGVATTVTATWPSAGLTSGLSYTLNIHDNQVWNAYQYFNAQMFELVNASNNLSDGSGNLATGIITNGSIFGSTNPVQAPFVQDAIPAGYVALPSLAVSIASGFGTSPAIEPNTGSATSPTPYSFEIIVGSGGTASSGVVNAPLVGTAYSCDASDATTTSATVYMTKAVQTGSVGGQTQITVTNYNTSGSAAAWVAADTLRIKCTPS